MRSTERDDRVDVRRRRDVEVRRQRLGVAPPRRSTRRSARACSRRRIGRTPPATLPAMFRPPAVGYRPRTTRARSRRWTSRCWTSWSSSTAWRRAAVEAPQREGASASELVEPLVLRCWSACTPSTRPQSRCDELDPRPLSPGCSSSARAARRRARRRVARRAPRPRVPDAGRDRRRVRVEPGVRRSGRRERRCRRTRFASSSRDRGGADARSSSPSSRKRLRTAAGGADELLSAIAETTAETARTRSSPAAHSRREHRAPPGQAGNSRRPPRTSTKATDAFAVLSDFVDRVDSGGAAQTLGQRHRVASESGTSSTPTRPDDDGGLGAGPFLLGGGAIVLGAFAWRRSKRQAAGSARAGPRRGGGSPDAARRAVRARRRRRPPRAGGAAATRRRRATSTRRSTGTAPRQAALEYADEPLDLVRVERVIDEARYSMDRVPGPSRRPPAPEPPPTLQHPAATASRR